MRSYLNYGQGLRLDYTRLRSYGDRTAFHVHPHYELYLLTQPLKTESIICGKKIITDYPCAMLTAPFIPHFTNALEYSGKYYRMVFYFGTDVTDTLQLPFSLDQLLMGNASRIFNLSEDYDTVSQLIQTCNLLTDSFNRQKILEILLNILFSRQDRAETVKKTESYILDVIDYIFQHLDTPCSSQELTERFFVSYNKLQHDFKSYTYMTINEFVLAVKLNRAKELLKLSGMPISEIAKNCGWESESYFYRFFRSRTGKTPLQYRKSHIIQ